MRLTAATSAPGLTGLTCGPHLPHARAPAASSRRAAAARSVRGSSRWAQHTAPCRRTLAPRPPARAPVVQAPTWPGRGAIRARSFDARARYSGRSAVSERVGARTIARLMCTLYIHIRVVFGEFRGLVPSFFRIIHKFRTNKPYCVGASGIGRGERTLSWGRAQLARRRPTPMLLPPPGFRASSVPNLF